MSAEKIIQTMKSAGKALRPGEIAELSGINKVEVEKIIKKLKTDGTIISPKKCFYEVK